MLLTKKSSAAAGAVSSPFVHSLRRGLSQALPTLDRRSFLRRSGLGVGVGGTPPISGARVGITPAHLSLSTP